MLVCQIVIMHDEPMLAMHVEFLVSIELEAWSLTRQKHLIIPEALMVSGYQTLIYIKLRHDTYWFE